MGVFALPLREIRGLEASELEWNLRFIDQSGHQYFRRIASAASVFTQLDAVDVFDHSTTTHLAASSASSMTWSNSFPGGIVRSHHTDQPFWASASASKRARSRSALA